MRPLKTLLVLNHNRRITKTKNKVSRKLRYSYFTAYNIRISNNIRVTWHTQPHILKKVLRFNYSVGNNLNRVTTVNDSFIFFFTYIGIGHRWNIFQCKQVEGYMYSITQHSGYIIVLNAKYCWTIFIPRTQQFMHCW
jgi:hypothetical protein